MSDSYKIVFRGDIAHGHSAVEVRKRLAQLFRVDDEGIGKLFCGRPVVIKKNLAEADASLWCDTLLKAGAVVQRVREEVDASSLGQGQTAAAARDISPAEAGLSIEPAGADLLRADERANIPPMQVNTAHLSLDVPGADVLRPEERSNVEPLILDLDHLSIDKTI